MDMCQVMVSSCNICTHTHSHNDASYARHTSDNILCLIQSAGVDKLLQGGGLKPRGLPDVYRILLKLRWCVLGKRYLMSHNIPLSPGNLGSSTCSVLCQSLYLERRCSHLECLVLHALRGERAEGFLLIYVAITDNMLTGPV